MTRAGDDPVHEFQLFLDRLDCAASVRALSENDDAAGDLSFAVEFAVAPPLVGSQFNPRHVAHQHRHRAVGREHDVLELEVQVRDLERPIGAFFEDVLLKN